MVCCYCQVFYTINLILFLPCDIIHKLLMMVRGKIP
nr:MAG TPA: hypothetical protein [Caudoviricetes sp.]